MTPEQAACDPRVARSRAAVLAATVELLGEFGHAGTTVEAVAERSGVAKTTIYRHWPTRAKLLFDAFQSSVELDPMPPTGDLRQDLLGLTGGLAKKLRNPRWSRIMATLIDAAEADRELAELTRDFTNERRAAVVAVFERGIAEGELDPSVDPRLASQLVGGALFYSRFMVRRAADDEELEHIVDLALEGLRKR